VNLKTKLSVLPKAIDCHPGEVKVYDSLYDDVDTATKNKLEKAFACNLQYIVPSFQKQQVKYCGLFVIALPLI